MSTITHLNSMRNSLSNPHTCKVKLPDNESNKVLLKTNITSMS